MVTCFTVVTPCTCMHILYSQRLHIHSGLTTAPYRAHSCADRPVRRSSVGDERPARRWPRLTEVARPRPLPCGKMVDRWECPSARNDPPSPACPPVTPALQAARARLAAA